MKIVQIPFASALCLLSLACNAVEATQKNAVPNEIHSFVGPTDILLAYQKMNLFGDGSAAAVIILRHQKLVSTASEENSCDLLILRGKAGALSLFEKSSKVVECVYNEDAQNSSDLNDNLELRPLQITYTNQRMGGYDAYMFKYSKEKEIWYLSQATSTFSEDNEDTGNKDSSEEKVRYPGNIPLTPLSKFDPASLSRELKKHKTVVH